MQSGAIRLNLQVKSEVTALRSQFTLVLGTINLRAATAEWMDFLHKLWIYKSKPSSVLKGCMCLNIHVGSLVGRANAKSKQKSIDAGAWNTQNQKMTRPFWSSKTHCECICFYQPDSKWLGCCFEVTPLLVINKLQTKTMKQNSFLHTHWLPFLPTLPDAHPNLWCSRRTLCFQGCSRWSPMQAESSPSS